jgi:hypothetical protein
MYPIEEGGGAGEGVGVDETRNDPLKRLLMQKCGQREVTSSSFPTIGWNNILNITFSETF